MYGATPTLMNRFKKASTQLEEAKQRLFFARRPFKEIALIRSKNVVRYEKEWQRYKRAQLKFKKADGIYNRLRV